MLKMENDFIPGNTPQGNRTTLHLLLLLLSSISYHHSLVLPKPLSKMFHIYIYIYKYIFCTDDTCLYGWSEQPRCCYSWYKRAYINKCATRFHWHYPTQRDNNVTFLTTLCILLEYPALCQDAQACSNRLSNTLSLLSSNKISPYTVAVLSWWMITGGSVWETNFTGRLVGTPTWEIPLSLQRQCAHLRPLIRQVESSLKVVE